MKLKDLENKKILVLGFGKEGHSTLDFLSKNLKNYSIAVADRKEFNQLTEEDKEFLGKTNLENYFGEDYLDYLEKFEIIIKSPGINPRQDKIQEALNNGIILTSASNLFLANKKGKVIAITGSKGKSTTSSLIYRVLKAQALNTELIGNIGNPALSYLKDDSEDKLYVFEMSSYQLEDYQCGIDIGVLVSFFPDHLDYHGSLEAYFTAKMQMLSSDVTNNGNPVQIVYNYQSQKIQDYVEKISKDRKFKFYPVNDGNIYQIVEVDGILTINKNDKEMLNEKKIQLRGRHNLENILLVKKVADLFDISDDTFINAVSQFHPLEHRLEFVGTIQDINFFNDSISTTPESTIAAINALSREKTISTIIVGGLDRGYNFDNLAQKIIDKKIKNLILFPETGLKIKENILNLNFDSEYYPQFFEVEDMKQCIDIAFKVSIKSSICLLSCAAPSYNLFKNFEERGKQFKEEILKR